MQPRVLAVLDWELSTLGHPIADLAFICVNYHFPKELSNLLPQFVTGNVFEVLYCRTKINKN